MNKTIDISFGQLCVFDAALSNPFNDWSPDHIAQGFAWRPQSVSFATLDASGPLMLEVVRAGVSQSPKGRRVVAVPFELVGDQGVEIASIASRTGLELLPGTYEITFDHDLDENKGMSATLRFEPRRSPPAARVLRADAGLSPPATLVMTAQPA